MSEIKGSLEFKKRIITQKQQCYGTCRIGDGRFKVSIASVAGESVERFAQTFLHEFTHLTLYIMNGFLKKEISEEQQHKLIRRIAPRGAKLIAKAYRGIK